MIWSSLYVLYISIKKFIFLKKKYDVVEEPDSVSKARMGVALLGVLRLCGK